MLNISATSRCSSLNGAFVLVRTGAGGTIAFAWITAGVLDPFVEAEIGAAGSGAIATEDFGEAGTFRSARLEAVLKATIIPMTAAAAKKANNLLLIMVC
jgi:hypothetical protein